MKGKNMLIMVVVVISLLVVAVLGTYAFVTFKQGPLTNVFTYGNVDLKLYQDDVSLDDIAGDLESDLKWDVSYDKNVELKFGAGGSSCYAFLVVVNELVDVESEQILKTLDDDKFVDSYDPVSVQLTKNNWQEYPNTNNKYIKIYWQKLDGSKSNYAILDTFRTNESFKYEFVDANNNGKIPELSFTVYAVEEGDLGSKEEAWYILKTQFTELSEY